MQKNTVLVDGIQTVIYIVENDNVLCFTGVMDSIDTMPLNLPTQHMTATVSLQSNGLGDALPSSVSAWSTKPISYASVTSSINQAMEKSDITRDTGMDVS